MCVALTGSTERVLCKGQLETNTSAQWWAALSLSPLD